MSDKPNELWLLQWTEPAGGYVGPALDDHGGTAYLAYPNEREATAAAEFQKETYDCDCKPVRVV